MSCQRSRSPQAFPTRQAPGRPGKIRPRHHHLLAKPPPQARPFGGFEVRDGAGGSADFRVWAPMGAAPDLGKVGLTCRKSCGRAPLASRHLRPVQGHWAQAPGPGASLQRPGRGPPLQAQALGLATRGHQKARASSGLWPPSCACRPLAGLQDHCHHRLYGCSGQRPQAQVWGAPVDVPGSCSRTPLRRQSYCRCHGTRHTRSGYTGPRRGRSTSGRPSPCRSHGHWAAGTAQGRLRGQGGGREGAGHQAADTAPAELCQEVPTAPSASDVGARLFPSSQSGSTPVWAPDLALETVCSLPRPTWAGITSSLRDQPVHLHPQN